MNEKQLVQLKEDIDAAKKSVATLNGQLQYQLKDLKETWKVSIKNAPDMLKEMENEIVKLEDSMEKQIEELEQALA